MYTWKRGGGGASCGALVSAHTYIVCVVADRLTYVAVRLWVLSQSYILMTMCIKSCVLYLCVHRRASRDVHVRLSPASFGGLSTGHLIWYSPTTDAFIS